jgi:general secretion pathway protein G
MRIAFGPHTDVEPQHCSQSRLPAARRLFGFTLLELVCTCAVVALLASIAIPSYRATIRKQAVTVAVNDLMMIGMELERFRTANSFRFPESLDDLPGVPRTDPWGFEYRYLSFSSTQPGIKGKIRKDHNLHPLNSSFDLYSVGPDGKTVAPLTAKASRDDVIWARDGSFIGVASDY